MRNTLLSLAIAILIAPTSSQGDPRTKVYTEGMVLVDSKKCNYLRKRQKDRVEDIKNGKVRILI